MSYLLTIHSVSCLFLIILLPVVCFVYAVAVFDTDEDHSINRFWGFATMLQLVTYACSLCRGEDKPIKYSNNFFNKMTRWTGATIRNLINREVYGEWRTPIQEFDSVYTAFEALARRFKTCHRVAVCMGSQVTGVITQSMMIDYIHKNIGFFSAEADVTVQEMRRFRFLVTVNDDETALDAFAEMTNRHVNAVGIINSDDKLVDVLSTSDLKNLSPVSHVFVFDFFATPILFSFPFMNVLY